MPKIEIDVRDEEIARMKEWCEGAPMWHKHYLCLKPEVLVKAFVEHNLRYGPDHEVDWTMTLDEDWLIKEGVIKLDEVGDESHHSTTNGGDV